MAQDNRGGPSSKAGRPGGGPGGGRDGRPGGGRGRPGGGGFGKGPARPVRTETYEDVKLLTRGAGFRIEKSVVAEKGTHKPIKTEYRLHREGIAAMMPFARLADAQAAATAPLPEPEAEPSPADATSGDAAPEAAATAHAEAETAETVPAENAEH
jgi:hypothetical protein